MSIINHIDNLRLAWVSRRAYFGLAIYNGGLIHRCQAVYELTRCSIAEAHLAAFQSNCSALAGLVWELHSAKHSETRHQLELKLQSALEKLALPIKLRTIAQVVPISEASFNLDQECLEILRVSSFFFYLGAKIPKKDPDTFPYHEVVSTFDILKRINVKNSMQLIQALEILGKHKAIDLDRTWQKRFFDHRIN